MKYTLSTPLWIHEIGSRANQEDSIYPIEGLATNADRMFILCDGMGGHESGEVASKAVCEAIGHYFAAHPIGDSVLTTNVFNEALSTAYDLLDNLDKSTSEKKMGTTLTFLLLHAGGATIAHIGDSRVYHIRPGVPKPMFFTRDHSLVNDLVRLGEMTEEEARLSPNRNVITRAMQPHGNRRAKADIEIITDIQPGDWFYLCSDGMLEQMENDELTAILSNPTLSDEAKREELISRTKANHDNHTAWMIHILSVEGTPATSTEETSDAQPVVLEIGIDDTPINEAPSQATPTDADNSSTTRPIPDSRSTTRPIVSSATDNTDPPVMPGQRRHRENCSDRSLAQSHCQPSTQKHKKVWGVVILAAILIGCIMGLLAWNAHNKDAGFTFPRIKTSSAYTPPKSHTSAAPKASGRPGKTEESSPNISTNPTPPISGGEKVTPGRIFGKIFSTLQPPQENSTNVHNTGQQKKDTEGEANLESRSK